MTTKNLLTKEIAKKFVDNPISLIDSKVKYQLIEDEAAYILGESDLFHIPTLYLEQLSVDAAKAISQFQGEQLVFHHLKNITAKVAYHLCEFKGDLLSLSIQEGLSIDVAKQLCRYQGRLNLRGFKTLGEHIAKEFERLIAKEINFADLHSINHTLANSLSNYQGRISFPKVEQLTTSVAEKLGSSKSQEIYFGSLRFINEEIAEHLNNLHGHLIIRTTDFTLTSIAHKKLLEMGDQISLPENLIIDDSTIYEKQYQQ